MHLPMSGCMSLPINMRKWMIDRYIQQKEKENEAMQAAQRSARSKK
jgi:hypothetical protein